jgi:hypothetical protein
MWARAAESILKKPDYTMTLKGMADRLADLKAVDYEDHSEWQRSMLQGGSQPLALNRTIDYIHSQLKPWVPRELARPDPFDYPLPSHVRAYQKVAAGFRNPLMGTIWQTSSTPPTLLPADAIMLLVPYVRLDWSVLP